MRITLHEIKKIWNFKILLVVAVLCGLFYFMYMDWHVHGAQAGTSIEAVLLRELTERYGKRVTAEQMEDFFDEQFPALISELEYRISLDPIFAEMGIFTYVDFIRTDRGAEWEEWQILSRMAQPENNRVYARLQGLHQLQSQWNATPNQIGMELEMERYGYNSWFSQTLSAALASNDVPAFVAELRAPILRQADEFIANSRLFNENGVANYGDFLELWDNLGTFISFEHHNTVWELWRELLRARSGFVERKLGDLDFLERSYEESPTRAIFEADITRLMDNRAMGEAEITDFAERRIDAIIENQDHLNLMPWSVFSTTRTYFGWLTILVALTTLVLVMPLVAVDRMRSIQSVQYSSKVGRRLMFRQVAAVMLSSLLLTTLLLVIFGAIYFHETGVHFFWSHNIFSFTNHFVALFDFSFGQYVIALAGIAYAVGLAAALLAFIVSRSSRSLIIAAVKIIPVFAGLTAFAIALNNSSSAAPFHMTHRLYLWTNIVGIEAIACAVPVALAFTAAWVVAVREKRVDVG
ncbi:MAG: hypothetical protein FWB75_04640 [Oscillospiraceae bacterium]|nr:hypothetical protein [Oscillospiraceae bacterium]